MPAKGICVGMIGLLPPLIPPKGGAGDLPVIQETLDGISVSLLTNLLCIYTVYAYIFI